MPFSTVLVANRGEIACRIIKTLRRLGIRSAAVYSDADADARHVAEADTALRLDPAHGGYANVQAVLHAARQAGADAVHPGYGFLSESPDLARACAAAELVFVGPDVPALELMGNKISARKHAVACGIPVIPGVSGPGLSDRQLLAQAADVGFPLLVKPAVGGGGQGMYRVEEAEELAAALVSARRFAAASFGDDSLLLERLIPVSRHIEVQILADGHGHTVQLGERECSLQRRRQKVIEEAPSPLLNPNSRRRIGEAARTLAAGAQYSGAGTVEFLVAHDAPEDFYFLEMNARLQVEHPVTELITGLDLVEWQLRIAAGEPLGFSQDDVELTGHAVEARIYAEDPAHGFLPSAGTVAAVTEPAGEGIRVDSALATGLRVSSAYDPLLAKTAAWGRTRAEAFNRLAAALAATWISGVQTNIEYLALMLQDSDVRAGRLDTGLLERTLPQLVFRQPDERILAAAALRLHLERLRSAGDAAWRQPDGWRLSGQRPTAYRLEVPDVGPVDVLVGSTMLVGSAALLGGAVPVGQDGMDAVVLVAPEEPFAADGTPARLRRLADDRLQLEYKETAATLHMALEPDGGGLWVGEAGWICRLGVTGRRERVLRSRETLPSRTGAPATPDAQGPRESEVRSPLPGIITSVAVRPGERVSRDQLLLTVEAMKMEHRVTAPAAGTADLCVNAGDAVDTGRLLARITAEEG